MASESPEHRIVCATPIIPGLILPIRRPITQAEKELVTGSAMKTRKNKGKKKKYDRLSQYEFTRFNM
jgi:hypothetical protein